MLTPYLRSLILGAVLGLTPIKRQTVDDWSDENVRLTSENSAEPGPFRTARMPFLREIFQSLSPTSQITDVSVMKGVQLGFTTSALNVAGCFIDIDPCAIMYVMPTITLAEAISKDRFTPMVENSPKLSKVIRPSRERDSGNTVLVKAFRGGRMIFSGANSAASLRSRPVRVLLLDEVDAFPFDVDGEGSPVSLAEKRQSTFGDKRKTYKLSTPTIKHASVIEYEVERTDCRKYFLPCPHCASVQHLVFDQMRWDEDDKENVWYECIHCHEKIEERHKTFMLNAGQWIPTKPENIHPKRRGYHINSLYSPLGMLSWVAIVDQYIKALDDKALMKTFVNSILGESYEEEGESPEYDRLFERRQHYQINTIPNDDIAFLTAGADVQRDRIELEIVGWCKGKISYSIDYRVLIGDTSDSAVWERLRGLLNERWRRPDGSEMPIRMLAIDANYNTSTVYSFCQSCDPTRVIPVRGDEALKVIVGTPRAVQTSQSGKRAGSARLWPVGVSLLKAELYGWLRMGLKEDGTAPDGFCYFPEYDLHYFKMLTAERLQLIRDKKGFFKQAWVLPSHARNEALDCRNYARAGAEVIGIGRFEDKDWETLRKSYVITSTKVGRPEKRKRDDGFLSGGSIWGE